MGYKKGVDRNQITMLPEAVDDFIPASSYVRFLDEFVGVFDLAKLGFTHGITAETGRPPYDPADLLKLYLYGFMNRLNSSRQLANACKTNLEVMWLLRRIEPDFRTISDFRKENGKAIRKLFRFFVKRIKALGVISGELVGIDGSKFAAVNSKDNNYSEKKLKKQIEHYDQRIKAYLRRLEENDASERETPELKEQLEQQLELVKQRQEKKKEALKELRESGQKQISTVDPDSKRMKAGDGTVVGYNVQATVEAEEKLIIDIEVTNNGNDLHELEKMATRAKEILERDSLKVAADSGYYRAEEVANCEKKGIETYVSKPNSPTSRFFSKNDFTYLKEEDCYGCRAGQKLFLEETFESMVAGYDDMKRMPAKPAHYDLNALHARPATVVSPGF